MGLKVAINIAVHLYAVFCTLPSRPIGSFVPLPTEGSLGYLAPINSMLRLLCHANVYPPLLTGKSTGHEETTSVMVLSLLETISAGKDIDAEVLRSFQEELLELYKHEAIVLNDPVKVFTAIRTLLDKHVAGKNFLHLTVNGWTVVREFPMRDSGSANPMTVIERHGKTPKLLYIIFKEPVTLRDRKPSIMTEYGLFTLTATIVHNHGNIDAFACIIVDGTDQTFIQRSHEMTGPYALSFWTGRYISQMYSVCILVYRQK